jgi:hypothetical protein
MCPKDEINRLYKVGNWLRIQVQLLQHWGHRKKSHGLTSTCPSICFATLFSVLCSLLVMQPFCLLEYWW